MFLPGDVKDQPPSSSKDDRCQTPQHALNSRAHETRARTRAGNRLIWEELLYLLQMTLMGNTGWFVLRGPIMETPASKSVDLVQLINQREIGRFHLQLLGLCAAVVFMDGFDAQAIGYVAPSVESGLAFGPWSPRSRLRSGAVRHHAGGARGRASRRLFGS